MSHYSWEHTTDMFQDAFEYHDFTGSKRKWLELAALFNPTAFREFFATFKAKKMGNDASRVTAESPIHSEGWSSLEKIISGRIKRIVVNESEDQRISGIDR